MANTALSKASSFPTIFDEFFKPLNDFFEDSRQRRTATVPAVNVTEKEKQFELALAVPGLNKEDIHIDLDGNVLTISAEKEENKEEKDGQRVTRREYNYTSFTRSFTLPESVQQDRIEARYENGVLKVELPKKEEAQKVTTNKQIAVK